MFTKLPIVLLITLTSTASFAQTQSIRFATEATYPPFEYMSKTGEIKGFDIDVANAICQQLKANCSFSNQPFDSLIPGLKSGKFDAIIAALGITDERKADVDFTLPYYEPIAYFVAPLAKNYSMGSIAGKVVGVQDGATFDDYLRDKYHDNITIKSYPSLPYAFLDLKAGKVDMVLGDGPAMKSWLKENDNSATYGIVVGPIVNSQFFGPGYGIAVNKDNQALLKQLSSALVQIKANGTYDKIKAQYFND